MNAYGIANSSGLTPGMNQMNGMSGASSYVPEPAASGVSLLSQLRADLKQNSQDFKALKYALNSSDLASATQAFTTLQQDIQKASQSAGGQSLFDSNSAIGRDFQAVGDALKSGDLSAAKQAFATFRQDIRSAGRAARASHHHHADNDGGAAPVTPAIKPAVAMPGVGVTLDATA